MTIIIAAMINSDNSAPTAPNAIAMPIYSSERSSPVLKFGATIIDSPMFSITNIAKKYNNTGNVKSMLWILKMLFIAIHAAYAAENSIIRRLVQDEKWLFDSNWSPQKPNSKFLYT